MALTAAGHGSPDAVLGGLEEHHLRSRLKELQLEQATLRGKLWDASGAVDAYVGATSGLSSKLVLHAKQRGVALETEARLRHASIAVIREELRQREQLLAVKDAEIVALRRNLQSQMEDLRRAGALQRDVADNDRIKRAEVAMLSTQNDMVAHNLLSGRVAELERVRQDQLRMPKLAEAQRLNFDLQQSMAVAQNLRAGVLDEVNRLTEEKARLAAELHSVESNCAVLRPVVTQQVLAAQQEEQRLLFETNLQSARESDLRQRLMYERSVAAEQQQLAVLSDVSVAEDSHVQHQRYQALHVVRTMAPQLRARGRSVLSSEVVGDPVDRSMHEFVQSARAMHFRPPSIWRIGPGRYIVDEDEVTCELHQGRLMVKQGTQLSPMLDYAHTKGLMVRL